MRSTFVRIIAGVMLTIIVLGVLRYRPWSNWGANNARAVIHEGSNKKATRELTVGFLPVTCHLTCPVTDYASKTTETNTNFNSRVITHISYQEECVSAWSSPAYWLATRTYF